MFDLRNIVLAAIFIYRVYAQEDASGKCEIEDEKCLRNYFQTLARSKASSGIREIGVPPLDPYHLENVTVSALDMFKMKLISGDCLGIGNCTLLRYETDVKNLNRTIEVICDRIVLTGSYVISTHPMLCDILGDAHGFGNGSIVLEDWYFKIQYPFEFVQRANGEIYLDPGFDQATWISDVQKKATIYADNIMVNDCDVTKYVVKYLNSHWKVIFSTLANSFHEISMYYYFKIYHILFDATPLSAYISTDLKPYLLCNRECGDNEESDQ